MQVWTKMSWWFESRMSHTGSCVWCLVPSWWCCRGSVDSPGDWVWVTRVRPLRVIAWPWICLFSASWSGATASWCRTVTTFVSRPLRQRIHQPFPALIQLRSPENMNQIHSLSFKHFLSRIIATTTDMELLQWGSGVGFPLKKTLAGVIYKVHITKRNRKNKLTVF